MQPRVTPVRNTLTAIQVESLIRDDASIIVGMGMELIDRDLNLLMDLTPYLRTCSVSRDNLAVLHGSCDFTLSTRLNWGRALVLPYLTITNGAVTARFNEGAYFTSTPSIVTDAVPATYAVTGFDILNALNTLVGDSYAINVGESYLTKIEDILTSLGYTQYVIDPARATTVATAPKGWPIDESTTWLIIVNEMLQAVGYQPIYSDWDGRLNCRALPPSTLAPEWAYTRGQYTGQLVPGQEITHDYFATPNRWVGIQGNTDADAASPVEGAGVFTYVNQNDGETSVNERDQVITRVITATVADQTALEAAVMAEVAKDKVVGTTIEAKTSVNPLHWHNDIVSVETLELGIRTVQQTTWTMDLSNKGAMSHSWAVL